MLRHEASMPAISTERFVHLKNLAHLREKLAVTNDDAERARIVRLIEEAELKDPSKL
jgi:hypothetical protein